MSKVIAIMDKPKDCQQCAFGVCVYSLPLSLCIKGYRCQLNNKTEEFNYEAEVHLKDCPLREVPQKTDYPPINEQSYVAGWNACIDEIMKGSEDNG